MGLRGLIGRVQDSIGVPEVFPERCVHAHIEIASCSRCVDACPRDAWTLDDEALAIDAACCDGCGLCVGACPEGALSLPLEPELRSANRTLVGFVCCEHSRVELTDKEAATRVPCVHAFGFDRLAAWYEKGVRRLALSRGECAQCPRGGAETIDTRVEALNRVLRGRDAEPMKVAVIDGEHWLGFLRATGPQADAPDLSRRGFLRGMLQAAENRAVAVPESAWKPPGVRLPQPGTATVYLYAPQIDLESCNGCDACFRVCPQAALQLESTSEAYTIAAERCTGCGLCVDLCEQDAVQVIETGAAKTKRVELKTRQCRVCGVRFHSPAKDTDDDYARCHVCARTQQRRGQLYQVLD